MTKCFSMFNVVNLAAAIACAGLLSASAQPTDAPTAAPAASIPAIPRRPNLILILADGLGYRDLGCYGGSDVETPNLDALAAAGTRFDDFYAGGANSLTARKSLMLGVQANHIQATGGAHPASSNQPNIAELLKAAGYHTGCVGLWGLSGFPQGSGFDEWAGLLTEDDAREAYPRRISRYDPAGQINDAGKPEPFDGISELATPGQPATRSATEIFTTAAINFIKIKKPDVFNKQTPFFLYLSYPGPRVAPTNDFGSFSDRNWPAAQKIRGAAIARLDADIGRIIDTLKSLKQLSNTVIVVTSSGGPATDGLQESRIRVPCLISAPGKMLAQKKNDQPWAAWDILPTLAEIGYAHPPASLDGISLVPLLTTPDATNHHEFLYWSSGTGSNGQQAARLADWKAVASAGKPATLYNVATDFNEKTNVASAHPDELGRLETYLKSQSGDSGR